MTYKNRLIFLLSLIAAFILLYAGSVIYNSGIGAGSSRFVWLDSKVSARAGRIVINRGAEEITLVKENNKWLVSNNGVSYPARQMRVEDFFSIFTKRASWPVRSSSASSHARFGLEEQNASKITIYGENAPLITLLIGDNDVTGNEAYFRKAGENEVRSGDNSIRTYLNSPVTSWYNLRLVPESEGGQVGVDSVQRLSVVSNSQNQVFSRRGRAWTVSGIDVANPDKTAIDDYVRTVLNTEGDNFDDSISADSPLLDNSRITLEFGNGRVVTIRLSEADESGRRFAHVSGSDLIYSIPSWAAGRLFTSAENLESQ